MPVDTPVLVVGAGPVGLTMAAFLHHHGVPCRIIDKRSGPTQTSNAVAIHARTLELMRSIGVLDTLIQNGRKIASVEIGSKLKPLAEWQMKRIDSDYNYALCVPQFETERILIEHLKSCGIEVERNSELIDIEQNDERCLATIKTHDTTTTIASSWVASCDGYHSAVRDHLKTISYDGDDMQLRFIMIDAAVETERTTLLEQITVYTDGELTLMLFPMQKTVRLAAEISRCHRYDDVDDPTEQIFSEIAKTCLPYPIKIGKPVWTSKFWIHERLASHYRSGRIFLAGDAGHAHSPAGGQGMNTGMQDAINLAWKIALVYHSKAHDDVLDSYEAERRPVAQNVIDKAGTMTKIMTSDNAILTTVRDTIAPLLSSFGGMQFKMANEIGETSLNYRTSPLNDGDGSDRVKPGDLCPIHELRANDECILLDFNGGDLAMDHVKVLGGSDHQAELLGLHDGGYCLIRPDGYVAYIGKEKPNLSWLT